MNIGLILKLLPLLIQIAQWIFGKGTGTTKREFVMNTLQLAAKTGKDISEGGQKETWDGIGKIVDETVKVMKNPASGVNMESVEKL